MIVTSEYSVMSQTEVAEHMSRLGYPMSRSRVDQLEHRALSKIAADPIIRKMAEDIGLDPGALSPRAVKKKRRR